MSRAMQSAAIFLSWRNMDGALERTFVNASAQITESVRKTCPQLEAYRETAHYIARKIASLSRYFI